MVPKRWCYTNLYSVVGNCHFGEEAGTNIAGTWCRACTLSLAYMLSTFRPVSGTGRSILLGYQSRVKAVCVFGYAGAYGLLSREAKYAGMCM
jgi:hypothetical protein